MSPEHATALSRETESDLAREARSVLEAHRRALAANDVEGVQATLAHDARAPSERDLLVDLAAAYGLAEAVRRMHRFWRNVTTTVTATRVLADRGVEIYEKLSIGGRRDLAMVTLVRERDGSARIVSSAEAPDPSLRLLVLSDDPSPRIDDDAWLRAWADRFGWKAELVIAGPHDERFDAEPGGRVRPWDGTLGHPSQSWLARVRGPVDWASLAKRLARKSQRMPTAASAIELTMTPSGEPQKRGQELAWLGRAAASLAVQIGAPWILLPRTEKIIDTDTFGQVLGAGPAVDGRGLASAFVRLGDHAGWAATRGLTLLGLPEVEIDLSHWPDPGAARRLVGMVSVGLIEGRIPPAPSGRRILAAGGVRLRAIVGRRGPEPSQTYGRFGALCLLPARDPAVAQSGTRIRIDI